MLTSAIMLTDVEYDIVYRSLTLTAYVNTNGGRRPRTMTHKPVHDKR